MATFLTTPRMNPALRERVERAVSHRARAGHHAAKMGLRGRFAKAERVRASRVLPLLALLVIVGLGSATYVHESRLLGEERASLLARIDARRAALPAGHEGFLARVDPFVDEAAAQQAPPDRIDPSMKEPGALDAWLGRRAVYVRGPAAELRDARERDDAAAASDKDAFLSCLLFPPPGGSEAELLDAVRGVYFAGAVVDEETSNVRRLAGTRVGLSVLSPEFEARVRAADDALALKKLRKDLEAAPIEQAAEASAAELLIVVADEASGRFARVALADLASNRALVRLRLPVPPAGKSVMAALHRGEMEGCGLALALRRSVEE